MFSRTLLLRAFQQYIKSQNRSIAGTKPQVSQYSSHFPDKEVYYKVIKRKQLLHWLVERERYVAINNLLMNLNHDQRLHLLAQTNSSGKTPHDVAKSGKLRALLEWAASQVGMYYLPTPPQVIIICNTQNREGAEGELQSFKEILPQFNLIPVTLKDPTREDIFDGILHTIDNRENITALFVIVMSHGQKGAVEATDGPVSLNEIRLTMNVQRLDGKPKVLLVQACQSTLNARAEGYNNAQDTVTESDARQANSVPQTDPHFDIKHPDFMVLMASVNGGVAYRNMLIPIFSRNLSQSSQNECLHEIFLKTHKNIREAEPRQVAEVRSTFTLKLCLKNVFNPDDHVESASAPSVFSTVATMLPWANLWANTAPLIHQELVQPKIVAWEVFFANRAAQYNANNRAEKWALIRNKNKHLIPGNASRFAPLYSVQIGSDLVIYQSWVITRSRSQARDGSGMSATEQLARIHQFITSSSNINRAERAADLPSLDEGN